VADYTTLFFICSRSLGILSNALTGKFTGNLMSDGYPSRHSISGGFLPYPDQFSLLTIGYPNRMSILIRTFEAALPQEGTPSAKSY
jgi:hypothetical protein